MLIKPPESLPDGFQIIVRNGQGILVEAAIRTAIKGYIKHKENNLLRGIMGCATIVPRSYDNNIVEVDVFPGMYFPWNVAPPI